MVAESGKDFIGVKCHLTKMSNGRRERVVADSGEDIIGTKCHSTDLVTDRRGEGWWQNLERIL